LLFFISRAGIFDTSNNYDIAPGIQKYASWVTRFYITHGMEGLKYMDTNKRTAIVADYTFAASEYEKEIKKKIMRKCKNIFITGYPRFDYNTSQEEKYITVLLTWRDYLNTKEEVAASEYVARLQSIIDDACLTEILEENDCFCYVKIHQLAKHLLNFKFNAKGRILVDQNIDFASIIAKSFALVTDYSSLAWDFIYYDKPVFFYQFDKNEYESKRGPLYTDVQAERIGYFITEHKNLIEKIGETIKSENKKYRIPNKNKFFKYIDNNNTKRVVDLIEKYS
jgi:CDP-glycerol glycerophosphotransferase (TagB/SpsB family)